MCSQQLSVSLLGTGTLCRLSSRWHSGGRRNALRQVGSPGEPSGVLLSGGALSPGVLSVWSGEVVFSVAQLYTFCSFLLCILVHLLSDFLLRTYHLLDPIVRVEAPSQHKAKIPAPMEFTLQCVSGWRQNKK